MSDNDSACAAADLKIYICMLLLLLLIDAHLKLWRLRRHIHSCCCCESQCCPLWWWDHIANTISLQLCVYSIENLRESAYYIYYYHII